MLQITTKAEEKLEEFLQKLKVNKKVAMRIVLSRTKPNEAGLKLDKERAGDQVIESKGGRKLLLMQSNVATELEGMVFDHKKNHNLLVEADIIDKMLDRKNFMLYLNDISAAHKVKYRKQLHNTIEKFDEE